MKVISMSSTKLIVFVVYFLLLLTKTDLKVIGIRPMTPVLNKVNLKVSEHEMLSFSVRKEIIKNDNSLGVILLSKVVENESLQTV